MNGSVSGPASRTIARPHSASLDRLIPATARGGALLIVALAGLSLPLSGSMAHARSGWTGVVAVAVAATVCCLAAIIALFLTERTRGSLNAISGLLGSVLLRTMVPLAIGFAISRVNRELFEAGVFGWFVVYYLGCLATETLIVTRVLGQKQDVEAEG